MKTWHFVFSLFLMFASCESTDDEVIDCTLFDPSFPQFFVKFVDNDGNNLIENGSLSPKDIKVSGDFENAFGHVVPGSHFKFPENNTLNLGLAQKISFEYHIEIKETLLRTLKFTAEKRKIPCDISFFVPLTVSYGNLALQLDEESALKYFVAITIN